MRRETEKYGVGSVTDGDWKRSKTKQLCSARASNECLKERKKGRNKGRKEETKTQK
jgi:hypothetical protein